MRDKYKLKIDKKVFFYPDQWNKFYNNLKEKQQPYFKIAINTGARINEIRNLKVGDINFERLTLTFFITKIRAKLKETRSTPRTIKISPEFAQWLQRWIRKYSLNKGDTFNIKSTPAIDKTLKLGLKKIGIENWYDFSSHNIRKTHGNWLKALKVDGIEIATRLGHDMNTMLKHYVSADLFSEGDRALIKEILGSLYC